MANTRSLQLFDGSSYVTYTSYKPTVFTISAFIKPTASGNQILYSGPNGDVILLMGSGTITLQTWTGSAYENFAGSGTGIHAVNVGVWTFVSATYNQSTKAWALYVGQAGSAPTLDTSGTATAALVWEAGASNNAWGARMDGVTPYTGLLNDCRTWDIVRSEANLQSDYSQQLTGSESNLTGYYKWVNNLNDSSSAARDGTAVGTVRYINILPFDFPTASIGLDAAIHITAQTGTTVTFTNAMTITNHTNRELFFVADGDATTDRVTAVTWHGQSMTKIFSIQKPSNRWNSYWYLLAPDVGTFDLVVTNSASAYTEPSLVCYYNVKQVAPEASASNSGTAAASGVGSNVQIVDGQGGYNIVFVDKTNNPQGAPGSYDLAFSGDTLKASVTTLTIGAYVVGFLGTGGGAWTVGALSILSIEGSPSLSPSGSPSPSASLSPSASGSASASRSTSSSASASSSSSGSASASKSLSPSASLSPSGSQSPSASVSPSPSAGFTDYTRGHYASLPTNDADLMTTYSAGDVTDVSTSNNVRVGQTGTLEYMVHQYKNFVGANSVSRLTWEGQSDLSPSLSTIYMQVYNQNSSTWETLTSNSAASANTDFTMIADILDLTNYKNGSNIVSFRIYQQAI